MKSETFPGVSEVLKRARVLISRGWCQQALARTKDGVETTYLDRGAVEFCAVGAVRRAHADLAPQEYKLGDLALVALGQATGYAVVSRWNNAPERTREEVLAAFDRAAGGK